MSVYFGSWQETISWLIGPVQAHGRRVGYEEVFKLDKGLLGNHLITQARPGQVVEPCGVGGEEL